MLQQKRIRKPPQPLAFDYFSLSHKTKSRKQKKKPKRCSYQVIPFPTKFIYSSKIYNFHAVIPPLLNIFLSFQQDLVALEMNNNLSFEPSLLNRFVKYEEIKITGEPQERLVTIKIGKKRSVKMLPWMQVVKKLKGSKDHNMVQWGSLIKDFSEKYENHIIEDFSTGAPINHRITAEFHHQENELLEDYPCIFLKSGSIEGKPGISEIVLNEEFMKEVGYPLDIFASQVLEEGIPQFMPYENEAQTVILRHVMEKYFELSTEESYQSAEISSYLFTKDNYIKDITMQFYLFPTTFPEGRKGLDIILALVKVGHPYQDDFMLPKCRINKNYTEKLLIHSKEVRYFLSNYYHELIPVQNINPHKVCGIRELEPPLEEEEDYYEEFDLKMESLKSEDI